MNWEKISAFWNFYKNITLGNFTRAEFLYYLKDIINANKLKLKCWPIGGTIDSNGAYVFTVFETCFQYRIWFFLRTISY